MSRARVVLLPGFQGRADQPILMRLSSRLEALGFTCVRLAPPRLALTPGLEAYVAWLIEQLAPLKGKLIVVGRSFGGRLAIRLAARRRLSGVVLLGFPIRPPGKRRPLDEQALSALTCPAFIAQGTADELGPMRVLRRFSGEAHLHPVKGAGHGFGAQEAATLDAVSAWMSRVLL